MNAFLAHCPNPSTITTLLTTLLTTTITTPLTATLHSLHRYALLYTLLIALSIVIQNSAYHLTPLAAQYAASLGLKATFTLGNPRAVWEQEFLYASHVATALVAAHWVGVVTLGWWVAGRLGVGVRVMMGDVDMGWWCGEEGEVKVEGE